ncbi:ABC transporter permease [Corynebacterium otitidis]|uniref:ABC transporter permease n=1 Tax=Corynebacterium otitidis TaxID=29321 RepID=UPI000627C1A3|nr:ABC transporter permease [Corynebacterium otitidis]KKO84551.1 multidrug ABC transporter permease [Corynebacterium otitidis]
MSTPAVNPQRAFPPGTFRPAPRRASLARLVAAQAKVETKLFLRHGEQELLSVVIPLALLIGLHVVPVLEEPQPVSVVFPLTLAIAAASSGFTGQAIALAFDRRYGALKRVGASGVPVWVIVAGRSIAVCAMVLIQVAVLTVAALILGWRAEPAGVALAVPMLLLGVACHTALGLLMGGALSSEAVLAGANLIWLGLAGLAGLAALQFGLEGLSPLDAIPTVTLASGLHQAFDGGLPLAQMGILAAWTLLAAGAATKAFRFTS